MEPASFISHKGKRVLVIDFSGCAPEDFAGRIEKVREVVDSQPPRSLLLLTDVTEARFNSGTNAQMKEYSTANTPFVKKSAVVGASGLRRIILGGIRIFTGRDIRPFDDRQSALDWLVS